MNDREKQLQLRKYKTIATGLFVVMAITFIAMSILQKANPSHWIGYVRAFSEAAMVGALADWFAVTALFHHPLGLKIPHTNLIQSKKEQIGDNLGNFVVDNFLAPQNIRPYILKLKVSNFVGEWLSKSKNQALVVAQSTSIILDIIQKLDDEVLASFISKKAKEMSHNLEVNQIVGNGLEYILKNNDHQKAITALSHQIKDYIKNHQDLVRERVKKESFSLIPKFVDDAIADKIVAGIAKYFEEVASDSQHGLRNEITGKLLDFSNDLKVNEHWKNDFEKIKNDFLTDDKLYQYSNDIWLAIKTSLTKELVEQDSPLKQYILKTLNEFSINLKNDEQLKSRIDHWIRVTAYKHILKNTHQFGNLISSTIGNWEGKELSNKLELEVGKDLQFIRINGTLVGGLVGLIIYTIAEFFI